MKSLSACIFALLAAQFLFAQGDGKTLSAALVKHWEASKDLSLAVANAMPETSYAFKATKDEMGFGEQMNHIALANNIYCGLAIGETPSSEKFTDNGKTAAVKNLTAAFDSCIAEINKMSDADLLKPLTVRAKATTPFELFWGGFTHTAHHRGQAEVYLRLKDITPPEYKF